MKRMLWCFIIVISVVLLMFACSNNDGEIVGYQDFIIKNGNIEITITSITEDSLFNVNNSYSIKLNVVNRGTERYGFDIKNAKVVRSSNNAEINASVNLFGEVLLSNDVWESFFVKTTLPTAIDQEEYILILEEKGSTYKFFLSNTPKESVGKLNSYEVYSDASMNNGGLEIFNVKSNSRYFNSISGNPYEISLKIKNTSETEKVLKLRYAEVRNESEVFSSILEGNTTFFILQKDGEITLTYDVILPTTMEADQYTLQIYEGMNVYNIHLFETPDELREDITISYMINSRLVRTETVKKGRALSSLFVYDTYDHQQHSGAWYNNSKRITTDTVFTEDTELTADLVENYTYSYIESYSSTILNRVNYVPADKVLVIPRYYKNKIINIGSGATFGISVKVVYLPETLDHIYSNNFMSSDLETIYYAGTEDQWNELIHKEYSVSIPSNVQVVFNTAFH